MANDDRTDEGQAAPDWKGAEQTSVGPASPATPPPAVPWTGGEGTMVGMPTPPRPGIPAGAVPWTGGEQTLAGMPAPGAAPAGAAPWTGGEQTLAGMPAGAAPAGEAGWAGTEATAVGGAAAPADPSRPATDPARKLGKTTATMDDGWHLKGRKGPMTGQTFGDYDIGGVLGEGGMGVVYRARQVSLKRRVALKVLPPALANDTRLLQRFEQEARTASLLNTPHVVQVFAAGTVDGTSFFAMEFVEGTDLSEIIKAKDAKGERFATEEAADYIIQAARGLAEAGKLGIVHRDIKPANLMVTSKGLVKVADFGISKVAGEHSLTMTGTAVGTPAYCSPEQGRGDAVDHRSDIYSLGVVLYELLTGRKPFDGATANALIYQHNYAEPTLLREIRADLSEEYQAIALKCLQKDPANRYQDAADLVGDLERVRAGSAPMTALMSAFGTGADEAMRRLGIKQRRVWPWIAAATVAILGAGGAYWWWQAGEQERAVARDERTRLREKLAAVIDKPVPVDASVPVDLRAYAGLVGDGDEDVVRWSAEIVGIQAAERDLAVLDREELPGAASRAALAARLLDHARWVGTAGQDHQRWTARLAQVDGRIADLRRTLAGTFDGGQGLTLAAATAVAAELGEFARLAGDDDADALRWRTAAMAVAARRTELAGRLAALDSATAAIAAKTQDALAADLDAYRRIAGGEGAEVQRWELALAGARGAVAGLRTSLARLDRAAAAAGVDLATAEALAPDLERLRGLVEADDPDLKRWAGLVADARSRVAALRAQLGRLDRPEPATVVEQDALAPVLAEHGRLAGTAGAEHQGWSRRLAQDRALLAARRAEFARFDDPRPFTAAEIGSLGRSVDDLDRMQAVTAVQIQVARQRLESSKAAIEALRARIQSREGADGFRLDKELGDAIRSFVALAGDADPDAKRWRAKAAEFFRLRELLAPLDQVAPVPDRAEALVAEYQALVGEDEDVRRWRDRIATVRELRTLLAGVDRVAPLPAGAATAAVRLLTLVGDADIDARRWDARIRRVETLTAGLDAALARPVAWVLPPVELAQAGRAARELESLVGRDDEQVDALLIRTALLEGPAAPPWAAEYGRDGFGLYATVLVNGQRLRFRYVPAGPVTVGSPDAESGRDADEAPVAMTVSRPFWLAETETTQALWRAVGRPDPSRFRGEDRPVERVSWSDTQDFLLDLNRQVPGLQARLPAEIEWELAARAGGAGPWHGHQGPVDAGHLGDVAWFEANAGDGTRGVGGKFPNRLGLLDMHGNVWEWCQDTYGPYSSAITTDWVGRGGERRVLRGGSFADRPAVLRAANRLGADPGLRTLYAGFRIAAPVAWPDARGPAVLRTVQRGLVQAATAATGQPP